MASVLSTVIALSSSISTAFWVGVACYVVALAAYRKATRHPVAAMAEMASSTDLSPSRSGVPITNRR